MHIPVEGWGNGQGQPSQLGTAPGGLQAAEEPWGRLLSLCFALLHDCLAVVGRCCQQAGRGKGGIFYLVRNVGIREKVGTAGTGRGKEQSWGCSLGVPGTGPSEELLAQTCPSQASRM